MKNSDGNCNMDDKSKDKGKDKGRHKYKSIVDAYHNYDTAFKDAMSVFKDKAFDLFGIDPSLKILEPLRTESAKISTDIDFSDLTFRLSNANGLHLEDT